MTTSKPVRGKKGMRLSRRAVLVAAMVAAPSFPSGVVAGDAHWVGDCPPPVVVSSPDGVPCVPGDSTRLNPHVWNGDPNCPPPPSLVPSPRPIEGVAPIPLMPPESTPGQTTDDYFRLDTDSPSSPDASSVPPQESQPPSSSPESFSQQDDAAQQTPDPFANAAPVDAPAANNTDFNNISASDLSSSFASTQSSFSSAPTIIGDFQGGGLAQINATITQAYSFHATGTRGALPTFDRLGGGGFNPDVLAASGTGQSIGGSAFTNQFSIVEPIPPTDADLAPSSGFLFQGGTATYTETNATQTASTADYTDLGNGDQWFIEYEYQQVIGGSEGAVRPAPSPGVSVRRVKISENFSPEVRDRGFVNYSFFNDTYGGLGDISRFVVGLEKVLVDDLVSIELRLPIAATYASYQNLDQPEDRDMEIGNFTLISKFALLRTERLLWSGGLGIGTPTADDTRFTMRGHDIIQIHNESVQIQPFTGLLCRPNSDWAFQAYMQLDVAAGGDPVYVNTNLSNPNAGNLNYAGDFRDSTLMHLDFAASRGVYRNRDQQARLNSILANAELHYTSTLEGSDTVSAPNFTYTNLKDQFDIVNATFGSHFVFNNGLIVTPAMSVPLRDGLDEQFDYEAIVQVNYIR
ncbi:hypothetical protein [Rhodopirellula sallentina]|uniref:hypothetical protein n=1 Tax=Rhodopirellula sallentina TaxID=1263869 RepID=UPI00191BD266|nr:hypothetical protein [Rhodopirellula sallentina]